MNRRSISLVTFAAALCLLHALGGLRSDQAVRAASLDGSAGAGPVWNDLSGLSNLTETRPAPVSQIPGTFGTIINPGDTITFPLSNVLPNQILSGAYRVVVPSGATNVTITLTTLTPGKDIDLYVRLGADLPVQNGADSADYISATPGTGNEQIVITAGSSPPLQEAIYFVAFGAPVETGPVLASISATITGGAPMTFGRRLQPGVSQNFTLGPVGGRALAIRSDGFRVDVPAGSQQLRIQMVLANPSHRVQLFVRRGFDVSVTSGGSAVFDYRSQGASANQVVTITPSSGPPLVRSTYYIGFGIETTGALISGSITATVNQANPPSIGVSQNLLSFSAVQGANPANQSFSVSNTGGGTLDYTVSDNQSWISVTPTSGSSTGEADAIQVSIASAALAPGIYNGTVTVQQTGGALSAAVAIELAISPAGPPQITLTPGSLTFNKRVGDPPTFQFLNVRNSGGGVLNFIVAPSENWLRVEPTQGTSTGGEFSVIVSVAVEGLAPGIYNGAVLVQDNTAGLSTQANVTLNLQANSPLVQVSTTSLSFAAPLGGPSPSAKIFVISNIGGGTLDYQVTTSQPWLSVSNSGGSLAAGVARQVGATVDVNGLGAGAHAATITVQSIPPQISPPAVINVTVVITQDGGAKPAVNEGGVLSAASFIVPGNPGHANAPGSLVAIFGTNLAPRVESAGQIPLPFTLAGTQVTFNGLPAALVFVAPQQINAQLPGGLTGDSVQIVVTTAAGAGTPRAVQTSPFSPALFTVNAQGFGQGWALIFGEPVPTAAAPVGSIPGFASRPARANDVLIIFLNGLGPVTPPIEDGRNSFDQDGLRLRTAVTQPTVTIGGVAIPPGNVVFAGLAPEFVGLNQINLIVPAGLAANAAAPIVITSGNVSSRGDVTIAVQ